jgi:thioredoxin reductase
VSTSQHVSTVVVGSGSAGSVAAHRLAAAGRKALLLLASVGAGLLRSIEPFGVHDVTHRERVLGRFGAAALRQLFTP